MNNISKYVFCGTAAALAIAATGCSLNEAWNPKELDGAACIKKSASVKEEDRCFEGYSCLITTCVQDYSLEANTTCLDDRQCKKGLVCPSSKFSCRKKCSNYYQSDSKCSESNVYCAPVYDSETKVFKNFGACLEGDCTITNADYAASPSPSNETKCTTSGEDCVLFKPRVGKCFKTCTYNMKDGEFNSPEIDQMGQTCHPVGTANEYQAMVEWTAGDKQLGEKCDPLSSPCARGLVCVTGQGINTYCHKLCDFDENNQQRGCSKDTDCMEAFSYHFCKLDSNVESSGNDDSTDRDINN